ncbi:hypothetical protein GGI35DRAFT_306942 [Trichoderma velutinum]
MVRYGKAWYGMVWHGMAWHGHLRQGHHHLGATQSGRPCWPCICLRAPVRLQSGKSSGQISGKRRRMSRFFCGRVTARQPAKQVARHSRFNHSRCSGSGSWLWLCSGSGSTLPCPGWPSVTVGLTRFKIRATWIPCRRTRRHCGASCQETPDLTHLAMDQLGCKYAVRAGVCKKPWTTNTAICMQQPLARGAEMHSLWTSSHTSRPWGRGKSEGQPALKPPSPMQEPNGNLGFSPDKLHLIA